jgi:hypothetical protein
MLRVGTQIPTLCVEKWPTRESYLQQAAEKTLSGLFYFPNRQTRLFRVGLFLFFQSRNGVFLRPFHFAFLVVVRPIMS